MADITAARVKELREATNVSMMECKRALVEADGDIDEATKLLRQRGIAVAAKKATRTANQGLVASASIDAGKTQSLVEVNCETDFVARNEKFITFVNHLAERAAHTDAPLADEMKEDVTRKIVEIGENIVIKANTRFTLQGCGTITAYIHLGGKVGVLVEVGCEKEATVEQDAFKELTNDLAMHIAACNPACLRSDDVPAETIASEREIFAKQVEDKPPQIVEKIVDGKLQKFFAEICLVHQGFVKEPKQSITELLDEKGKALNDTLCIRRFVRYQLGA